MSGTRARNDLWTKQSARGQRAGRRDTTSALHELYAMTQGSISFYEEAAKQAKGPAFTLLFNDIVAQRATLGHELSGYLQVNQEHPNPGGTVVDALHETWLKMRGFLNAGNYRVLLIEAERAEDRIKGSYERLIKENPGSAMNDVLLKQYATIKETHDRIRGLRDTASETQ